LLRSRGEKSLFHGSIDDRQYLETLALGVVVDRDLVLGESACRRRVEEPAEHDFLLQRLLDASAVQHRLQDRSSAHDQIGIRPVLARLVVRDTEDVDIAPMLDEIDRAAQDESTVDDNRIGQAPRIPALITQSKAEFEVGRYPRRSAG